jgi:glycosyltransferase involved in cell wall biosynthesis
MNHHDKRKRILFVLPSLTMGGAERVLITLMNHIDRQAFAPELVTISDSSELGHLIAPDITHHNLGAVGVVRGLPQLYSALKRMRPDIVVSTMAHMNFALMSLKSFFPGTRFIVREAITPSFLLNKYRKSAPLIRQAYRRLYPRADCILSPAQMIANELAAITGLARDHFVTLANPVNVSQIRAQANTPMAQDGAQTGSVVRFVAAGRLGYQKGFDRLIDALAVTDFSRDWHLAILGEGHARGELQSRLEQHGLQDHISMPGLYSNPWPAYARADAFILPSRYEGLPNVVLEALACGTQVLAMREAGGVVEIARHCEPGATRLYDDIHALTRAMAQQTPGRIAPGDKPSLLPEQYDTGNVIEAFNSLLQKV